MKKLLLSLIISGASVCAFAQPTWNLETWSTMNNGVLAVPEEPTSWVTGNQLDNAFTPGNDTSVFKVSGTEAHSGTYAMKITTVDVVNMPASAVGLIPDPVGIAFTGKVQATPSFKIFRGFAYTSRPATCSFWYKYTPQLNDSASCFVTLSKWNGASRDIISSGKWQSAAPQGSYIQQTITMDTNTAFLAVWPDTMEVDFSATRIITPTIGSILWVDDITFAGSTGINEHAFSNEVTVFPNPATNYVNIIADVNEASSVIAYDVTGKVVSSASLKQTMSGINRKEGMINTSNLSAGLYSYAILDERGNTLRNGKFSIIK
ncbi:MAG: T9SS type A sorting domain-containing protein [Bacteroidetes bacterium]|nr:T9SS type A sorting domain-containing protein [Bacteroidota bacterium]